MYRNCLVLQSLIDHFSREKGIRLSESFVESGGGGGIIGGGGLGAVRRFTELENILLGLNLQEYIHLFNKHNVDLAEFLLLTEDDLKVPLFKKYI